MIGVSAPVLLTQMYRFDVTSRPAVRKTHLSFLNFSYVCLEPVLVKRSFLYKNGAKGGVFLPRERQRARSIGCCGRLITTISTPAPMRKRLALGKTFVPSLSWKVIIFVFHSTGRQYVEDGWGEEVVF
eukprot:COSAG06_NODE_2839_length_6196_cov_2.423487_8_plen_128_part_00